MTRKHYGRCDRRDECIEKITEIIIGSHAGQKRDCKRRDEDEEVFRPLTPYDFVFEETAIQQIVSGHNGWRGIKDNLRGLLEFPDYETGTLKIDEECLPECVDEAHLFSGRKGHMYVLAVVGSYGVLVDEERIETQSLKGENLISKLRKKLVSSQLQFL